MSAQRGGMPVIRRWDLSVDGCDCPECGAHYTMARARCAVRHDTVDCVTRKVAVVPLADIIAVFRSRPLGEPAHPLSIRPDEWAANFIEREFGDA